MGLGNLIIEKMSAEVKTVDNLNRVDWRFTAAVIGLSLGVFGAGVFPAGGLGLALLWLWLALLFGLIWPRPILGVFFLCLALGWGRWLWYEEQRPPASWPAGETREFAAFVAEPPEPRETGQRLTLRPHGEQFLVHVYAPTYPPIALGDELLVSGEPVRPEVFESGTGRVVDYPAILRRAGVYYQMFNPRLTVTKPAAAYPMRRTLDRIKNIFENAVGKVFPEPSAALLHGILLGSRAALGVDWQERFRVTGLIHIVVLSGYNLTVVAEGLRRLLGFLPRHFSALFSLSALVLFTLMTGAGPATVRAALMAGLALVAGALGRAPAARRGLWAAGLLMVWHNPAILRDDLGFQLSFLATAGLLYLSPVLENFLVRSRFLSGYLPRSFAGLAAATLSAQIFILPWVVYRIGAWPTYALFTNLLVLPFVPAIMFGGFFAVLAALTSVVLGPVGTALAWITMTPVYFMLLGLLTLVRWVALWPWANLELPPIPWTFVVIAYSLLGWWAIMKNNVGHSTRRT